MESAQRRCARGCLPAVASTLAGGTALAVAPAAHASLLPPDLLAPVATGIAWFVVLVIPVVLVVLFWMVHVLPEKIAHKRHHPQRDAIKMLCLLSLAFGGLLWPLAWLWAYIRPVGHMAAYGTDKHDDYFVEQHDKAIKGQLLDHELAHLREELDAMDAKGALSADLKRVRADLRATLEARGLVSAQPTVVSTAASPDAGR